MTDDGARRDGGTGAGAEAGSVSESETGAEAVSVSVSESETGAVSETGAASETGSEAVSEPETGAVSETGAASETGSEPETRSVPAAAAIPTPAAAPRAATAEPAGSLADLQAAVGVRPSASASTSAPPAPARRRGREPDDRDDDRDDDGPRRPRRWPLALALSAVLGGTVAAFVLIGRANREHYYLRCTPRHIVAEQGRSFPPWGSLRLDGAAWKPIAIPPAAECTPRATDDLVALEAWYLEALVDQATVKLSGSAPGDIDQAQAELEQAMLLTRSPERRDQRKELERLLGDVTYWRAAARVKGATTALEEAARVFDDAAGKRPRHASDAAAWAELARATAAVLGRGPGGGGWPQSPPSGVPLPGARPLAPPGVALPVEPEVDADAGVPAAEPDASTPGLPSGGVLM